MRSVFRALLRFPAVHRYLQAAYRAEALARSMPTADALETVVGETLPLEPVRSELDGPPRLNLMVPALSVRHVFGGIGTALHLFERLIGTESDARIILTDEHSFGADDNPAYAGWRIMSLDDADADGRIVIPAGNRYGRRLPVAARDRFMATAWWTAALVRELTDWQASAYGMPEPDRFIYLIQDYEPGFYPWSARFALADATYRDPTRLIPVFNSGWLAEFFASRGYGLDRSLVLEPGLHPALNRSRLADLQRLRDKRVLVYGRPGTQRNAFPLICEGLRRWVGSTRSIGYELVSVGEPHPDIPLGNGRVLASRGKLTLEQYAEALATSQIGISLMISPHPSYPPLEMAAFGMSVLTNRFEGKDLARLSSAITSLPVLSPAEIAGALDRMAEAASWSAVAAPSEPDDWFQRYLAGGTDLQELAAALRRRLAA